MAQCTSQTQYIYSQENVNDSIPCYASCRRCRDCLDDLKLGTLRLNLLFWQTVYSDYFEDMTEIDQERGERLHAICLFLLVVIAYIVFIRTRLHVFSNI